MLDVGASVAGLVRGSLARRGDLRVWACIFFLAFLAFFLVFCLGSVVLSKLAEKRKGGYGTRAGFFVSYLFAVSYICMVGHKGGVGGEWDARWLFVSEKSF